MNATSSERSRSCVCQPPKKEIAGKVTHRIYAIEKNQANRLDLAIGPDGGFIDAVFYWFKDDRRVEVNGDIFAAIEEIVTALERGQIRKISDLAEGLLVPSEWAGGDILTDVLPQEFYMADLNWPILVATTFE